MARGNAWSEAGGWAGARLRLAEWRPSAVEMARALPDDSTVVLELVAGRGAVRTTAFLLNRDGAMAFPLPPVDSLRDVDDARVARRLGAALADPVLARLDPGTRRLLVVPDDQLHDVAWEALLTSDGRRLVERVTVAEIPSIATAMGWWRAPPRPARTAEMARPLLVVADPRTDDGVPMGVPVGETVRLLRAEELPGGGAPLPGAAREARVLARRAVADVLAGRAATERAVKRALADDYSVVHFATHARASEHSVDGSAILLAPTRDEDGLLHPAELGRLTLRTDVVVLSACGTARGTRVRGEGVRGIAAPFLAAGARAVLATRWEVGDSSSMAMMQAFYDALTAGASVGDALRTAQRAAIAAGASPRVWAAYTVIGDPRVRPALAPPARWAVAASWVRETPLRMSLAGAPLLLVVAALGAGVRRLRRERAGRR
jgi:CHAT domain-containing protein